MPLSKTQEEVAACTKRFRVVIAGRRWGKTTLAIREMCKIAREPNKDVYYIAPSYRMSRTIIFKRLKQKLLDLRWVKKINETNLEFSLKNGSTISLKGADNPDSLRGVSLSAAVFDEFAFMDREVWDTVIRPALSDQQGSALFITTPIGKSNWAYDLYCMQEEHRDNWQSFTYTTLEGGFVPPEEIEAAKAEMSEQQFKQEFEASFVTASNLIAWAFSREHNVCRLDAASTAMIHVGMDFNVTPLCAAVFVQHGREMYQIDEILMHNSHTGEVADEIRRRYPQSKIMCYPDPSGRQRRSSAGGQTDFTILQNCGFTVLAPTRHNAVRDRINSYNAQLCSATGIRSLFIDPKCKYTIESLEKYSFKTGTQVPDKPGGEHDFSHMFDAASYCIDYLKPIKRDRSEISQPRRWAHNTGAY
jgi:phage terminase large subunit